MPGSSLPPPVPTFGLVTDPDSEPHRPCWLQMRFHMGCERSSLPAITAGGTWSRYFGRRGERNGRRSCRRLSLGVGSRSLIQRQKLVSRFIRHLPGELSAPHATWKTHAHRMCFLVAPFRSTRCHHNQVLNDRPSTTLVPRLGSRDTKGFPSYPDRGMIESEVELLPFPPCFLVHSM